MGPYIDSGWWDLLQQSCLISASAAQLGTLLPSAADASARQLGLGLGFSVAGALVGGVSVSLAGKKRATNSLQLERTAAEREHQLFLAAAESSPDAFCVLNSVRDEHGNIVDFSYSYINRHAQQKLQSSNDDLHGASYRTMMGEALSESDFQRYCKVVETGVPATLELSASFSRSEVTVLRQQIIKFGDGLAISSSDISELKTMQDRLNRVAQFSSTIFDHAPFSIIATDASGTITAMNSEAELLTGYPASELVNNASILDLYDPEELRELAEQIASETGRRPKGLELIADSASGGSSSFRRKESGSRDARNRRQPGRVQERECMFVRRDGTRISVGVALKLLWNSSGERAGLIATAYDVSSRRQATNRVPAPGMRDPLTGLIGHGLLEDRISQAIKRSVRSQSKMAVFTIDLDDFKRINDSLGHRVGDEILAVAASRLLAKVRTADTLARIGGDEFIIVVSDQTRIADVEFCADLFLSAVTAPYQVQGHTINVTASLGACVCPDSACDTEDLLRRSEAAMYAAKEAGRNRWKLFEPRMVKEASSRLSMEGALRKALDHNELFLEYQPQVALPHGEVVGMEALLRWKHPQFGLVSPAHFIPMAEKIGLLPEFGDWAMRRSCREARWIQTRLGRRVTLSVNLSPNQFEQKKLLRTVEESLDASGLAASDLDIEIIESTLMIDSTENLQTLQMIRDLGVHLSIDDFGTGFCNFNYLMRYQVDRLKIDQSFVRQAATDGNAASVVRTVIAMAHGLGIKIIAEGVETREQLKFLMRRRCDQAQGYLFARPLSPEQFVQAVPRIEAMHLNDPSGEHIARKPPGSVRSDADLVNGIGRAEYISPPEVQRLSSVTSS